MSNCSHKSSFTIVISGLILLSCSVETLVEEPETHQLRSKRDNAAAAASTATVPDEGDTSRSDVKQDAVTFQLTLLPMLEENCVACHSVDNAIAGLNLADYAVVSDPDVFSKIINSVTSGSMPPVVQMPTKDSFLKAMQAWRDLGFPRDIADLSGKGSKEADDPNSDLGKDNGNNSGDNSNNSGNSGNNGTNYKPFYDNNIAKVYESNCISCHNPANLQGGFDLSQWHNSSDIESDPIEKHRLAAAAAFEKQTMPPSGPLPAKERLLFEVWHDLNVPKTQAEYDAALIQPKDCNTDPTPRIPVKRLSTAQIIASLLFLLDQPAFGSKMNNEMATEFSGLVDDAELYHGAASNGYQRENPAQVEAFFWAIVSLADKLTKISSASRWKKVYTACLKSDQPAPETCFKTFVSGWKFLIHRLPPTVQDLDALWNIYQTEADHLDGLRLVWKNLFLDPRFMWRIYDQGVVDSKDPKLIHLSLYERADILAFALAGRTPGIGLLNKASDNSLASDAVLDSEFDRLIMDNPYYWERFAMEWWDLRSAPDYGMVSPTYIKGVGKKIGNDNSTDTFRQSWHLMRRESRHIVQQGLSYSDFYTIPLTEEPTTVWDGGVNASNGSRGASRLWAYYFSTNTVTDLPEGRGVLNRIANNLQNQVRSNPITRGFRIAKSAVCYTPGDFPEDSQIMASGTTVPARDATNAHLTNTQMALNTTSPAQCQQCHVLSDKFGVAMEGIDVIGAHRTMERVYLEEGDTLTFLQNTPVDNTASFTLDGQSKTVTGVAELSQTFIDSSTAQKCFVKNFLMNHALSQRKGDSTTACMEDDFQDSMMKTGGSLKESLRKMIKVYLRKKRL